MAEVVEKIAIKVIQTGTVVRNHESGVKGVVIDDPFEVCGPNEVPVVYEGTTLYGGTDVEKLELIGPENAQADFVKCGAGRGEEACIFLTIGPEGPECQRFGSLRNALIARKESMTAQREPSQLYPACQLT